MINSLKVLVTILSLSIGVVGVGAATQGPSPFIPEETSQVTMVEEVTVIGRLPTAQVILGDITITPVRVAQTPVTKINTVRDLGSHTPSAPNPTYLPGAL